MPGDLNVLVVEPGTEVTARDGKILTVTDDSMVVRGDDLFMTPRQWAALNGPMRQDNLDA